MTIEIIGRVVLALLLVMSGVTHFTKMKMMVQMMSAKRMPMPGLMSAITGLVLIAGGLGIGFWFMPVISMWLIIGFLTLASLMVHDFWKMQGEAKMQNMHHFMGNMMLAASLLILVSMIG